MDSNPLGGGAASVLETLNQMAMDGTSVEEIAKQVNGSPKRRTADLPLGPRYHHPLNMGQFRPAKTNVARNQHGGPGNRRHESTAMVQADRPSLANDSPAQSGREGQKYGQRSARSTSLSHSHVVDMVVASAVDRLIDNPQPRHGPKTMARLSNMPAWIRDIFDTIHVGCSNEKLHSLLSDLEPLVVKNLADESGNNLLHKVCQSGHLEQLKTLRHFFAGEFSDGLREANFASDTPLDLLIKHGHIHCFEWLVEHTELGTRLKSQPEVDRGNSLLHIVASACQLTFVQYLCTVLLDRRLTVDQRNLDGETPLHVATAIASSQESSCHSHDLLVISVLLQSGADAFIETRSQKNCLDLASANQTVVHFILLNMAAVEAEMERNRLQIDAIEHINNAREAVTRLQSSYVDTHSAKHVVDEILHTIDSLDERFHKTDDCMSDEPETCRRESFQIVRQRMETIRDRVGLSPEMRCRKSVARPPDRCLLNSSSSSSVDDKRPRQRMAMRDKLATPSPAERRRAFRSKMIDLDRISSSDSSSFEESVYNSPNCGGIYTRIRGRKKITTCDGDDISFVDITVPDDEEQARLVTTWAKLGLLDDVNSRIVGPCQRDSGVSSMETQSQSHRQRTSLLASPTIFASADELVAMIDSPSSRAWYDIGSDNSDTETSVVDCYTKDDSGDIPANNLHWITSVGEETITDEAASLSSIIDDSLIVA